MAPKIELVPTKKLVGKRIKTSLAENMTFSLWKSFKQMQHEIESVSSDYYSVEIYDGIDDFKAFTPDTPFEKWAAKEVKNFDHVPAGMETLVIPAGLYAVFIHKGTPSKFPETANHIFNEWLPSSDYILDDRPHFEVMDAHYRADDEDAEETVWIPIQLK